MGKIKLFCIPFAGGSAVVYSKWKKLMDPFIVVNEVELAGRGRRMNEPLIDNMEEMVEDIYYSIKDYITEPYAIFGHSMGGLLTYELCHKLQKEGYPDPVHVFVSGRKAPQLKARRKIIHDLPNEEFISEILKYDGMDKSIFENKELADIFLPILKADFKLIETYEFNQPFNLLNFDISVFHGIDDKAVDFEELSHWSEVTKKESKIYTFPGGHFFINEYTEQVVNKINETFSSLKEVVNQKVTLM
ncbi:thioesterase [Bacillus wiedmannii]|uniref:thioesterase II family protein n=1 Tax=Bacillus wiedmannii TaxID=1890302 RepID=UPI001C024F1E|nr:thioesterase domain-containing protein [Bacillus wiedmannii]QWI15044.1 thioesterase [Bacillus wiedmannii]